MYPVHGKACMFITILRPIDDVYEGMIKLDGLAALVALLAARKVGDISLLHVAAVQVRLCGKVEGALVYTDRQEAELVTTGKGRLGDEAGRLRSRNLYGRKRHQAIERPGGGRINTTAA